MFKIIIFLSILVLFISCNREIFANIDIRSDGIVSEYTFYPLNYSYNSDYKNKCEYKYLGCLKNYNLYFLDGEHYILTIKKISITTNILLYYSGEVVKTNNVFITNVIKEKMLRIDEAEEYILGF